MVYFYYKGVITMENILKKYREELHKIPETAHQEFKTKEYLKQALIAMGYSPVDILETGLYVFIDNNKDETIAFRSDIDALPTVEETNLPFTSTHQGRMHACGHDGHMAMLLGLAKHLRTKVLTLRKNILLIFQPAEESVGGAKQIVDTGLFQKLNVVKVFGIHLYPEIPEGTIASRPNEFMAMVNEINIEVHGKSSHGAMPQLGIDSNIILAKLLIEFENIQARLISPLESTIITFGKIKGGIVRNSISEYAIMEGTIRSFSETTQNTIITSINNIAKGYEKMYNAKITVDIRPGYLPVINDPNLYQEWQRIMHKYPQYEFPKPLMIAEDFSFYQRAAQGLFYFVGTKNEQKGYVHALHSPKFNFSIKSLEIGLDTYITLLQKLGVLDE